MTITIATEHPLSADLSLLMARHADAMHADTPPESIHMMDAGELADAGTLFYVMREAGHPIGMGALKPIGPDHAEIKSMHILIEARGRGLARRMLDHLMTEAHAAGFAQLSLETGSNPGFAAARGLYVRAGFAECPPFEGYGPDPNSIFMTCSLL